MILYGTFFPLISEAFTGEDASIGAPWFNRFATPLAIVLVLFMGLGPAVRLAPGHPGRAAHGGRDPARRHGRRRRRAGAHDRDRRQPDRLRALPRRHLHDRRDRRGDLARRRRPACARRWRPVRGVRLPGDPQPAPLRRLRGPRRAGPGAVRDRRLLELPDERRPADGARRHGDGRRLHRHLRASRPPRPTARRTRSRSAPSSTSARTASRWSTLAPSREYFSGPGGDPSEPIRSFFEGEPTSEVGRDEGLSRDLWTAMQPDLSSFDAQIDRFDARYAKLVEETPPEILAEPGVQQQLVDAQGEQVNRADRALPRRHAAGRDPLQRQPVRELVLDRGDRRRGRRAVRPLAERRGPAPPRLRRLRRSPRPRAQPDGVSAAA